MSPDDLHDRETQDELMPAIEIAIPRGKAQIAVALRLATVNKCLGELEEAVVALAATGEACARQLDASAAEAGR